MPQIYDMGYLGRLCYVDMCHVPLCAGSCVFENGLKSNPEISALTFANTRLFGPIFTQPTARKLTIKPKLRRDVCVKNKYKQV
jgi:hypothetical protein